MGISETYQSLFSSWLILVGMDIISQMPNKSIAIADSLANGLNECFNVVVAPIGSTVNAYRQS